MMSKLPYISSSSRVLSRFRCMFTGVKSGTVGLLRTSAFAGVFLAFGGRSARKTRCGITGLRLTIRTRSFPLPDDVNWPQHRIASTTQQTSIQSAW